MKTFHIRKTIIMWMSSLCIWLALQTIAPAAPYTTNLDPLIAELQARSAALTGTTNKDAIKLKKAVDKILLSFDKPSTSLATDLKTLGVAAKYLAKLYPADFIPAPLVNSGPHLTTITTNLDELIQMALDAFGGDIYALAEAAQTLVTLAPASTCKDKAQAVLDDVANQLALVLTAPDNDTAVKILSTATKGVLKGQTLAATVAQCGSSGGGGGGGGGGGNWYDWSLSFTVNNSKVSFYENGQNSGPDVVAVTYFNNGTIQAVAYKQSGTPAINFTCNIGNPGGGTHSIVSGSYFDGVNSYTINSGTVTITKWPKSFPDSGKGTFSFTATGTAGTISGTSGSFSTWIYPPF